MKSLASDNNVEAPSSHYLASRHGDAGDTRIDAVAVGHRLIRSLAIRSGVESCSPADRWYLHLPGTATDGRHNPAVRDGRQGHPRSVGAHSEARGARRLPPRPQSDDLRGDSRPAGGVGAHGVPAALLLVPRGCPRQCRLHPALGRAWARQTLWRRVPDLQAERAEMGSEVDALGRWVQKPVVSGRSLGPRTIDINLQTDKRHGPCEPSGGGTEHLAGGIVLGGGRRNRNLPLPPSLLKP